MLLYGFTDGAEDDAALSQFFLESRLHADAVHDGIHCRTAQCQTLLKRYAQLVERLL